MLGRTGGNASGGKLTKASHLAARTALASLVVLVVPFTGGPLRADHQDRGPVSDEVMEQVRDAGPTDHLLPVIVQMHGDPSDAHLGRLQGRGGKLKSRHLSISGYSAEVPAAEIASLAADPDVERIS